MKVIAAVQQCIGAGHFEEEEGRRKRRKMKNRKKNENK